MESYEFQSKFNEVSNIMLRKVTRMLSQDSRMSVTEMAKQLNVSRKTVENYINKAEKEFGIKYTVEFDEERLNLNNPHMILVKFAKKPRQEDIKRVLSSSHIPQLAAVINGTYDLLIYANAENSNEYVYWDKTTQVSLSEYKPLWQSSDLAFIHLGFFPLRNSLLDRLQVPDAHKKILLLLNENARMSFSEMSRRLKMKPNTLAYNFKKLLKSGYIKRFTMVMTNPPQMSLLSLFGKYRLAEGFENDAMAMRKEVSLLDDKMPLVSRCLFSGQLIGSYDFFFVGAYDDYKTGYDHLVRYYRRRFRKHDVRATTGTIGKVLLGDFPIRNLDVRKEFDMMRWIPGAKPTVEAL